MMKTIWLFLLLYMGSYSQAQKRLYAGDQFPRQIIEQTAALQNPGASKISLQNKHLVLYFWATSCKACLRSFPKLDSLQKEFGNQIQFIMVNHETKSKVDSFLAPRKKIKLPQLPLLYERHDLRNIFPYYTIPHVVWIDPYSKVRAITDNKFLSRDLIKKLMDGQPIQLHNKNEVDIKFENAKPAIEQDGNPYMKNLTYFSYFMPYNPDLPSTYRASRTMINYRNIPLQKLYERAYGEDEKYLFLTPNSVVIDVKDKTPFQIPRDISIYEWKKKNMYTYEIKVPEEKAGQLFTYMQQDLDRCLPYKVKVENRKIKCLVLTRTGDQVDLRSNGGKTYYRFSSNISMDTFFYKNGLIKYFIKILNRTLSMSGDHPKLTTPIVDATHIDYPVDIQVNASIYQLQAFRKELQKLGLDLVEKDWEYPVLVIEDR